MPRYLYECTNCTHSGSFFHLMDETIEVCEKCNQNTMSRIFKNSFMVTKKQSSSTPNVGTVTKEYIEENKKVLKEQQAEAQGQTYE